MSDRTDRNRPLYMISVAAQLAGVHPQTLRAYEQKGLVSPQRTSGNTRMYSPADIERLELINELTSEGINLAGVIRILDLQGRLEERDTELGRTCTSACAVWLIACTSLKRAKANASCAYPTYRPLSAAAALSEGVNVV